MSFTKKSLINFQKENKAAKKPIKGNNKAKEWVQYINKRSNKNYVSIQKNSLLINNLFANSILCVKIGSLV